MSIARITKAILRNFRRRLLVSIAVIFTVVVVVYNGVFRNADHIKFKKDMILLDSWPIKSQIRLSPSNRTNDGVSSLIKFVTPLYTGDRNNFTFDNAHMYPCSQPNGRVPGGIEDLMCIPRPNYLPGLKNPCYRKESEDLYCLPYYHVLGFDKSGTTDLSSRLTSHPSIMKCNAYLGKEIYYWGWRRYGIFVQGPIKVMTMDEYIYAFRDAAKNLNDKIDKTNQPIVGDGGPVDGWDFRAWDKDPQNQGLTEPKVLTPHHVRHILRDPRFIFIMREPADRLYSDYFYLMHGNTPEKFHTDVTVAIKLMEDCLKINTTRHCFFSNELYRTMPLRLHISCYSVFLREWLAVFHRKHFIFIRTEDYHRDMKGSLESTFTFLGVEVLPTTLMDTILQPVNKLENASKRMAGPMYEQTRKLLNDFYAPCKADLRDLLGDDKYLWLDHAKQT